MYNIFLSGLAVSDQAQTVASQTSALRQAAQSAAAARTDVSEMRDQVERLAMLTQAMWELVAERLHLTETDLEQKAQEVDLRDGKADGKMSSHPLRCPQCGRVSNSRHKKCLYCGLLFEGSVFG
ncbi:MAG TPA: hypothetical protein ENN29_04355 [Candidatus Hydrogenedentes bacterium]|nr:hypothetical protein [Candidatus Hydrogenedentota bacterium]